MIGDDIKITVMNITKQGRSVQVSIGIKAPREIPVHRQEIYDKIKQEEVDGNE